MLQGFQISECDSHHDTSDLLSPGLHFLRIAIFHRFDASMRPHGLVLAGRMDASFCLKTHTHVFCRSPMKSMRGHLHILRTAIFHRFDASLRPHGLMLRGRMDALFCPKTHTHVFYRSLLKSVRDYWYVVCTALYIVLMRPCVPMVALAGTHGRFILSENAHTRFYRLPLKSVRDQPGDGWNIAPIPRKPRTCRPAAFLR